MNSLFRYDFPSVSQADGKAKDTKGNSTLCSLETSSSFSTSCYGRRAYTNEIPFRKLYCCVTVRKENGGSHTSVCPIRNIIH